MFNGRTQSETDIQFNVDGFAADADGHGQQTGLRSRPDPGHRGTGVAAHDRPV